MVANIIYRGLEFQSRLNCRSSNGRSGLHVQHALSAFLLLFLTQKAECHVFYVPRASSNPCETETGVRCCFSVDNTDIMMPRLSREESERALGMLQAYLSVRIIVRRMNCHHSTISRLRDGFRATGKTVD